MPYELGREYVSDRIEGLIIDGVSKSGEIIFQERELMRRLNELHVRHVELNAFITRLGLRDPGSVKRYRGDFQEVGEQISDLLGELREKGIGFWYNPGR